MTMLHTKYMKSEITADQKQLKRTIQLWQIGPSIFSPTFDYPPHVATLATLGIWFNQTAQPKMP